MDLMDVLESLKDLVKKFQNALEDKNNELEKVDDKWAAMVGDLHEEIRVLKVENKKLELSSETWAAERKRLEDIVKRQDGEISRWKTTDDKWVAEIQRLMDQEKRLGKVKEENDRLKDQVKDEKEKLGNAEVVIERLEYEGNILENEKEGLAGQVNRLQRRLQRTEDRIKEEVEKRVEQCMEERIPDILAKEKAIWMEEYEATDTPSFMKWRDDPKSITHRPSILAAKRQKFYNISGVTYNFFDLKDMLNSAIAAKKNPDKSRTALELARRKWIM